MKTTNSLFIITPDDFKVGKNANEECERIVSKIGFGKHLYGGKHYYGHHIILEKWKVRNSLVAQIEINNLV